jgi:hypothetical protein
VRRSFTVQGATQHDASDANRDHGRGNDPDPRPDHHVLYELSAFSRGFMSLKMAPR